HAADRLRAARDHRRGQRDRGPARRGAGRAGQARRLRDLRRPRGAGRPDHGQRELRLGRQQHRRRDGAGRDRRGRRGRHPAHRRIQGGLLLQRQGALIALVVLVVFGAVRYGEKFATGYNLSSFTGDTAKYALVALGMTFVIMTGGIDLSVGSVAALGGVVAIKISEYGLLPGLLAGIAAVASVGALTGL